MNDLTATRGADLASRARAFVSDPTAFFDYSYTKMHSLPRDELEALQLTALQQRFEQMYNGVAMVKKLADKQHFAGINTLDDVVPMLFEHTMYKSYPPSLLENNRFDQLTKWLDKLTTHDLSKLDASGCESITEWLVLLEEKTPLKINHSSGTSGTMSFNPLSKEEYRVFAKTWPMCYLQEFGDPGASADNYSPNLYVVSPSYRYGANAFIRGTDMHAASMAGAEERVYTLYPGRLDSDVLYLAARIRAAKLKGTLDQLKISQKLLARQKEFEAQQLQMVKDMETFFRRVVEELAGKRVFMLTTWNMIYDLARSGVERGVRDVFAKNSVIVSGGGAKGLVQPPGWEKVVCEFTGVSRLKGGYGMSEICATNVACVHGHFHFMSWLIGFVLDPDTSKILPRTGSVTGRAAFFDLVASSHWGGFITGDEITVHWDGGCPCGAKSAFMGPKIARYSEKRGGDDKISCAATPAAHKEAMDFLVKFEAK